MTRGDLSVLMLSWEFPPRVVGGISSHVFDLSMALAKRGIDVHVVTCDFPRTPEYEQNGRVRVYRFNSKIPSPSFLGWIFSMNQSMAEKAVDVLNEINEDIDVIHAHDWLVAEAAIKLRDDFSKPLVSTIHATEMGRRGGIRNDYQRTINEVERHLVSQSNELICCSEYMAEQISCGFNYVQSERLHVIPNGVDAIKFNVRVSTKQVRQKYSKDGEKIVCFVGRLVHEKGVHVLIGAAPKVLEKMPDVNFVIVGEGGMKDYLAQEAWDFGVAGHVFFAGFVDDETLISVYQASDAAVFPSLYEPFGIAALEAMAARTPVIVSDTGGLAEIVEHEKTGIKVFPDNSDSLAWGILRVLQNPTVGDRIRKNAYQRVVKEYDWNEIAEKTIKVYESAMTRGRKPKVVRLTHPFLALEEYPETMRILLLLHILCAVDETNAKRPVELEEMLGMSINRLNVLLQSLLESGHVAFFRDSLRRVRYFLTKLGILKVCSTFS
ncbi:MAG TPA: glycosyltransferase family 4 protein [Candidatus Bathyarchaeia archaeon]|nr:glycosyltransferase family 4 protein [Candidatus Bathyarchaeia archaeon]